MKTTLNPALLAAIIAGLIPAPSRAESVVVQWEKVWPANGSDAPSLAVAVDSANNAIVTGRSHNGANVDYYTAKYAAANGALLWGKRYNGPANGDDIAISLAVDSADNVIVTGRSHNGDNLDYYTAKYAATNGTLLWENRYNGPFNRDDDARSLTVDSAGNVIVTGGSRRAIGGPDIYTAKYAAANGALLWEKRYEGPEVESGDAGSDVAVDSAGNVIVTGTSSPSAGPDYYTAKYAAADGALLWEKRYHGPETYNIAYHVVVDSQGNAIVTGDTYNSNDNADKQYMAKYAAADGALLWEQRFIGPCCSSSSKSLVLDEADNVIIADGSYSDGNYTGGHLAKYAAADGALLWEKRDNRPGVSYGGAAVDDAGNVIVTGTYTTKYSALDGALLWEKRTGGGPIAVDSAGGIIVVGGESYIVKYVPADADQDGLLDSWEVAHFGSTAAHSSLDDTDGDGTVELLELAFGTNPKSPGSVPAPAVVVEDGYLTTTIAKQPGVTYLVQTSATPGADFSAASTTVLTDTVTTLKVRDNVLTGAQPARFLRVQVTAAP